MIRGVTKKVTFFHYIQSRMVINNNYYTSVSFVKSYYIYLALNIQVQLLQQNFRMKGYPA